MRDQSPTIKELRASARTARRSMSVDERTNASRRIADRFLNSRYFLASDLIGCYISTWEEVDTSAIIERAWRAGKRVFLPIVSARGRLTYHETTPETELTLDRFGIWQPVSGRPVAADDLDVVVTPLVAFDDAGHRIGMGAGYIDRTFAFLGKRHHWRKPKLIGVAFECQRAEEFSPNPWDIGVFRVFTEAD